MGLNDSTFTQMEIINDLEDKWSLRVAGNWVAEMRARAGSADNRLRSKREKQRSII